MPRRIHAYQNAATKTSASNSSERDQTKCPGAQGFDQIRNHATGRQQRGPQRFRSERIKALSNRCESRNQIESQLHQERRHHRERHGRRYMLLLRVNVRCDASCYPNQGQRRQELAHSLHPSIGALIFLLAFPVLTAAEDPPANLAPADRGARDGNRAVQSNYTYRQTVTLDELNPSGLAARHVSRSARHYLFAGSGTYRADGRQAASPR